VYSVISYPVLTMAVSLVVITVLFCFVLGNSTKMTRLKISHEAMVSSCCH